MIQMEFKNTSSCIFDYAKRGTATEMVAIGGFLGEWDVCGLQDDQCRRFSNAP
ncbi:MAG TPA: hypothetical protein VJ577_13400 [Burkholderiaceae bacterium]|nr:hypothetical protein [Burkholderiaceae bacterium]